LKTDRGNRLQVDPETLETSRKGVFAGGDAVSGPASVIEAIAAGGKAASSIDKYLSGGGAIYEPLIPLGGVDPCLGLVENFATLNREKVNTMPVERRLKSFDEVEFGFDEKTALSEAARCLRCNLRLQISPVTPPPLAVERHRERTRKSNA
jgi:heterodisulfide reductase subunit A-like polyferredoxin